MWSRGFFFRKPRTSKHWCWESFRGVLVWHAVALATAFARCFRIPLSFRAHRHPIWGRVLSRKETCSQIEREGNGGKGRSGEKLGGGAGQGGEGRGGQRRERSYGNMGKWGYGECSSATRRGWPKGLRRRLLLMQALANEHGATLSQCCNVVHMQPLSQAKSTLHSSVHIR